MTSPRCPTSSAGRWGGQLALRAIAEGVLRPRHLTLIATPWQFVGPGGMGKETFTLFRESYQRDPARSMERFAGLVAKNDTRQREILRDFRHHPSADDAARWLPWLDALAEYHPDAAFLEQLPPTLAIHGEADAIVPVAQAEQFCALPNVTISRWEGTGHAPHLHDPARLAREIAEHRRAQKAAA